MRAGSSILSLALVVSALTGPATAAVAPKTLYRDHVFDGAAGVSIVYDRDARHWTMPYTNRRATKRLPNHDDVKWGHGTAIGIATSPDGVNRTSQRSAIQVAELKYKNGKLTVEGEAGLAFRLKPPVDGNAND